MVAEVVFEGDLCTLTGLLVTNTGLPIDVLPLPVLPLVIPLSSGNVELDIMEGRHTHGCVTNPEEMYLLPLPEVLACRSKLIVNMST